MKGYGHGYGYGYGKGRSSDGGTGEAGYDATGYGSAYLTGGGYGDGSNGGYGYGRRYGGSNGGYGYGRRYGGLACEMLMIMHKGAGLVWDDFTFLSVDDLACALDSAGVDPVVSCVAIAQCRVFLVHWGLAD